MEALKSAVLLDIENLVFAAKDDFKERGFKVSLKEIVQSLAGNIKAIAVNHGCSAKYLFGAISLPPVPGENEPQGWHRTRKEVSTMTHILADNGFKVMTAPSSENAADNVLKMLARIIAEDPEVGSVLLCSGDGRDPFPEIMNILEDAGKQVWAVVYNRVPQVLINYVCKIILSQNFHLQLDKDVKAPGEVGQELPSVKKDSDEPLKIQSIASIYRDVVEEIKEGKLTVHPVYYERLVRAVSVLEKHFRYHRTQPTHRLIQVLENEFPDVSSEELRQLFFALADSAKLFFDVPYYGLNDPNEFLLKIKAIS